MKTKTKKVVDIKVPNWNQKVEVVNLSDLSPGLKLNTISKNYKPKADKPRPCKSCKSNCLFIAINCVFITAAIVLLLTEVI